VLVRDAHGKAIGNLKKEDFQVFDRDKPQTLSGFTIQQRAAAIRPEDSPRTPPTTTAPSPSTDALVPQRFIVFLFDDLHLATSDLALAQKASTKMLAGSLAETDMAAVLATSGRTNSGLTADRTKLAAAIMSLREQRIYRPVGRQCPDVSYYQGDLIINKNDARALSAATDEALICANMDPRMRSSAEQMARSAASQALTFGEQGTRVSLQMIKLVVKKMAALPGQHTLILVSPGFLSLTPEALAEKSEIMDTAAQANVTISALDARGLYVTGFDASEPGGPPQVLQAKAEYHRDSMSANEDVMAELADATGGAYFHNSNDLSAGFHELTLAPEYLYLLEFTPQDVKQDGAYHRLKVKVNQADLKIQARRGYFSPKPTKKK